MTAPDVPHLSPHLLGLYIDEAVGRATAIVAALTARPDPADGDIAWAAEAAHSLKGLTMQAGDTVLAEEVHAIETDLESLRHGAEPTVAAAIVARVRAVEQALVARGGPGVQRDIDLQEVADAAGAEVLRVASHRGVHVSVDLVLPPGVRLPRRVGGVLVDVLGHLARNAVVHGAPDGGAVRMTFATDADGLTIVVSDRGDSDRKTNVTRRPDLSSGRGVGLRAAHGRLAALGGELSVASGAWGGTSVTVRIPL